MATLNRVLSFLILVLAIVAGAFAYLLYERRMELRDRGDVLASTLATVVEELDSGTGTDYADTLHRRKYTGKDGKDYDGGTLGWAAYHDARDPLTGQYDEFSRMLGEAEKQAKDVLSQRNALASSLSGAAKMLRNETLDDAAFQKLDAYEKSATELKNHIEAVDRRDKAVSEKIGVLAEKIKHPIDRDAFQRLDGYNEQLEQFGGDVDRLWQRSATYVDTLAQLPIKIDQYDFEVNSDMIQNETQYAREMVTLLNDFTKINEKLKEYERQKLELLETKDNLEKTIESLEDANENVAQLEDKLVNLEANYRTALNKLEMIGNQGNSSVEGSRISQKEGRVIDVNYDWNYIIIDLGARHNLPPKLEMIVARENEYICKVLVTTVYADFAVAEILPDLKQGQVFEGDRVIF